MLLIMSLLALSMAFAAIQQPDEKPDAEKDCSGINSIGLASNSNPAVMDPNKLIAILTSNEIDYYCLKNILGLWDYNFYITITDTSGANFMTVYSEDWNTNVTGIFGVFPGNDVLVDSLNSGYAQSLSTSTTYSLPQGGMTGRFIWDQQTIPFASPTPDTTQRDITPSAFNFENSRTFKRVIVIDNGEAGYETALLTLGVWY